VTRRKLIDYIKHPYLLQELSIEELQQWVEDFPYSQNLRILLAQKVKSLGLENEYPHVFHNAAMHSPDREILYDVLEEQVVVQQDDTASEVKDELAHAPIESTSPIEITQLVDDIDSHDSNLTLIQTVADDLSEEDVIDNTPLEVDGLDSMSVSDFDADSIITEDELKESAPFNQKPASQDNVIVQLDEVEFDPKDLVLQEVPRAIVKKENGSEDEKNERSILKVGSSEVALNLSEFSKWLISIENSNIDKIVESAVVAEDEVVNERINTHIDEPQEVEDQELDQEFQEQDYDDQDEDEDQEDDPSSESLANLFAHQGHKKKAIEMYEKLMLINPEKSTYFAAQIEKIKES
jgi:hypothetical protein